MLAISIEPSGEACGALTRGVDLREPLSYGQLEALRAALFTHHALCFDDQPIPDDTAISVAPVATMAMSE